jgi:hypothetical protein
MNNDKSVVQDPLRSGYRVIWYGILCAPCFDTYALAEAYLQDLEHGRRKPQYYRLTDPEDIR